MLKIKMFLGISLLGAFILVNALANVIYKEEHTVSSMQLITPYGTVYPAK